MGYGLCLEVSEGQKRPVYKVSRQYATLLREPTAMNAVRSIEMRGMISIKISEATNSSSGGVTEARSEEGSDIERTRSNLKVRHQGCVIPR